MLHIILVILKIAGILLAAVLFLILAVLLLLLFVPIRYRLSAKYEGAERLGTGMITWLFHLISFQISYESGKDMHIRVKVLGIPIFPRSAKTERPQPSAPPKKDVIPKTEETPVPKTTPAPVLKTVTQPVKPAEPVVKKPENPSAFPEAPTLPECAKPEDAPNKKSLFQKIRELFIKIRQTFQKLFETLRNIRKKFSDLTAAAKHYLEILNEAETKAVLKGVKGHIFYILKHYRPRKVTGHLRYGLKDPALTGQLTGLLYILKPKVCSSFYLEPVFETESTIIQGEVDMKGHIRFCHVLHIGIKLLFDKNLKHLLKRMKE